MKFTGQNKTKGNPLFEYHVKIKKAKAKTKTKTKTKTKRNK